MALDAATLNLAGGFITVFSGFFVLVVWWQHRRERSALWWSLGNCLLGAGIILAGLHAELSFLLANVLGPLFLNLSAPCALIAAKVFDRGSIAPYRMTGFVVAWVATIAVTGALASERMAAALGAGTAACFYLAAARSLWGGRGETLRGRMPLIGIVTTYAVSLLMLVPQFILADNFAPIAAVGWLGVIEFVGLAYSLGVMLFLPMMLGSRNEKLLQTAALTDPLTGLPNRRAFMDRAQRVLDRQGRDGHPVALLASDLDRFKTINDTFGHATGDKVLGIFADVLSASLRPTNVIARIGGEEFVAVLGDVDDQVAVAIANRVREALETAAQFVDGQRIGATVSVGIAVTDVLDSTVIDMMQEADVALYRAKSEGRNRVALARANPGQAYSGNVVRIA
jgi:diguanylate cyclase (GGDEF)-like protein